MRRSATALLLFLAALLLGATSGWGAPPPAPASVNGMGTAITLSEGPFPGLTFTSSEPVSLIMECGEGVVQMIVQPADQPLGVVAVALRGLPAGSVWYLYDGENPEPATLSADAEGTVAFSLDLPEVHILRLQSGHSTYILRNDATGGDCTKIGTWNRNTCTLTQDVFQTIDFGAGSITLDGAGHTVSSYYYVVHADGKPGITIRNLIVEGGGGYTGVAVWRSDGSLVDNCIIRNAQNGLQGYIQGGVIFRNIRIENVGAAVSTVLSSSHLLTGLDLGPASWAGLYNHIANTTLINSVVHDSAYGIFAGNNGVRAYNNIFRDCATEVAGPGGVILNTTKAPGPNIIGGPYIGGNFYTKSDGTGFSDSAPDVDPNDGFADQPYTAFNGRVDDLPLVVFRPYVNQPPALAPIGDRTVGEGQTLTITLSATDPNPQDTLAFSAANLPPGSSFDNVTGTFTWTPGYDQAGVYAGVEFTVTDNGRPVMLDVEVLTITVGNTNRPPVFTPMGPQSVLEYNTLTFALFATDPDGDTVTLQAGALPPGASFDPVSGVFTWRPDGTQVGVYPLAFFAVDSGIPPLSTELDVVVTVGNIASPIDLIRLLIAEILARNLPDPVVNSYMANLKKVEIFIIEGKVGPAINQVDAFINKCEMDIQQGIISWDDGQYLLMIANDLLGLLRGY